jgi:hypothetical protein
MRFYPFGSSSLNQTFNPAVATTASIAQYAASSSYGIRAISASFADNGVKGLNGTPGTCSYTAGQTGDIGLEGIGGSPGGVSVTVPKP